MTRAASLLLPPVMPLFAAANLVVTTGDELPDLTQGEGEMRVTLTAPIACESLRFGGDGVWSFEGEPLTLTGKYPFPWDEAVKPSKVAVFENDIRFSNTGIVYVYGGKEYRGGVSFATTQRVFFSREYNNAKDDSGSCVRRVAFSGPNCTADFSTVANVGFGANKSNARDGVDLEIRNGASLTAKLVYQFPGSQAVLTNATMTLTASGTAFSQTRESSFRVCKGGLLVAAGLLDLGQNNATRPEPSTFVINRGTVQAGSATVSGLGFSALVENGGTLQTAGDVSVVRGQLRVTDGRVIADGRLRLAAEGRLVLDPVRASIGAVQAPVFAEGAKIALDPACADCASGRFLLTSWDEGTLSGNLETLFDASSAKGRAPRLSVETEEGRGYLWLDLDASAHYPRIRVMAIGDSITEGKHPLVDSKGPYGNWRMTCWKALAAAGYDVTAVGWRDRYPEDHAARTMPLRWRGHAGISGQYLRTADGRAGHLEAIGAELDQAGDVDVVLMMIGTNDIERSAPADELLANWTNLVGRIITARPAVRVVCGTIVDRTDVSSAKNRRKTIQTFNAAIHGLAADASVFPANQVTISENYDAVPIEYFYNTLHPDWPGMIRLGCAFAEAAVKALKGPGPTASPRPVTVTRGCAANVPEAYRCGFRLARTLKPGATTHYTDGRAHYDAGGDPKAATSDLGRVGYYIELRRKNTATADYQGHVRWLWADCEAFGDRTLEAVGFPFADGTRQRRVNRLHVVSNEPLIGSVPPDDETQQGWIQFSPHTIAPDPIADPAAPADFYHYDWNDTFGTGYYGAFQLARILPGQTPAATMLFAYNRWARRSDTGATEIVLGDFAERVQSTTSKWSINGINTYDFATMNAGAYDEIVIEIYTKPAKDGMSVMVR